MLWKSFLLQLTLRLAGTQASLSSSCILTGLHTMVLIFSLQTYSCTPATSNSSIKRELSKLLNESSLTSCVFCLICSLQLLYETILLRSSARHCQQECSCDCFAYKRGTALPIDGLISIISSTANSSQREFLTHKTCITFILLYENQSSYSQLCTADLREMYMNHEFMTIEFYFN